MERAHHEPGEAGVSTSTRTTSTTHGTETTEAVRRVLRPRAVALVGASDDLAKFSGQPLRNLLHAGYSGEIHPVNRRGGEVCGRAALTSVAELPEDVDTAMVMVPAAACAQVVRDLGAVGVPTAIIAVSGFAEVGTEDGRRLQDELAVAGRESGVRLVGPNCNGVYETRLPLPLGYNFTHSQILQQGSVALVAHSGAMLGGFVPQLEAMGSGLSGFVSCGNEVDLDLVDYVEYFIDDEATEVIALILDGVEDGPRLRRALAGARAAGKPVVALKLGNSTQGTAAAQAHSSRMAGTKAAYEAVFNADGVVTVPTLETLSAVCAVLAHGRRMRTRSIVGLSTSGAGGVLLADVCTDREIPLARLSEQSAERLAAAAGFAQAMNPFDIGAAGAGSIAENLSALAEDPGAGALVFYLTPTPTLAWRVALAEGVADLARRHSMLPVLVISPAPLEPEVAAHYRDAGVPVVPSTLDAVTALQALAPEQAGTRSITPIEDTGQTASAWSEPASRAFLREHGVPVPSETVVAEADAAAAAAGTLGYPVVLKAAGTGLTHKSDHGLVRVGLVDAEAVVQAHDELARVGRELDPTGFEGVLVTSHVADGEEIVVGVTTDADFGPFVLVGAGGVTTELMGDVAVAPAPLDIESARRLLESTRVASLLAGYRGSEPLDVDAVVDLLVAVSRLAVEAIDLVSAIDLNPVRVFPAGQGVSVLDALVVGCR